MSEAHNQVDLMGETVTRKGYLTKRFPGDAPTTNPTPIEDAAEFYCTECLNRVTESPDGDVEYGHEKGCTHSNWRVNNND